MAEPTGDPAPVTLHVTGAGTATITRIRHPDGGEYAEIRLVATLPTDQAAAAARLTALATHLRTLLGPGRPGRPPST